MTELDETTGSQAEPEEEPTEEEQPAPAEPDAGDEGESDDATT